MIICYVCGTSYAANQQAPSGKGLCVYCGEKADEREKIENSKSKIKERLINEINKLDIYQYHTATIEKVVEIITDELKEE